jgi:hypothetical protein
MIKKTALVTLALATSLLNSVTLPAVANPMMSYRQNTPQKATISQSSAIVVSFSQNLEIDAKQEQGQTLTLPLAQPITDGHGNELVPAGSPVSVKIVPEDKKGVYIIAESIVVNGQLIPIQATSSKIASVKIKVKTAKEQARENRAVFGNLGGNVAVGLSNDGNEQATETTKDATTGAAIGNSVGIISGLLSAENVYLVRIPQGSVYVLQLNAPITLPVSKVAQANNYPSAANPVNTHQENPLSLLVQSHQPAMGGTSSNNNGNSSMYHRNGQTISPEIAAKLRNLLARHEIKEANCDATNQQVKILVDDEFVVCGLANNRYQPGTYRLSFR